jgi:outer membrane autotransporter protein
MMGEATFWRDDTGPDLTGITPQTYRAMNVGPSESEPERVVTSYQPRTWRLWTTGFGGTTSLDGDAATGSAPLDTRYAGFAVGLDYQIDRTTLVGIAGGYTNSGFSLNQLLTSGTVEGTHVGLYGVKLLGPFYVSTTAEYAHFNNETERFIDWVLDEQAKGNFTSDEFGGRLEAGWKRSFGGYNVTPFARLDVSHLWTENFSESSEGSLGGPGLLGLTFGSNSVTSLASSLGMQLDTRIALSNGDTLTPFVRVAWVHEFNPDRSVSASLTLAPAASFSPEGASAASDVARVDAGLKLDVTERIALFGLFVGEFSGQSQGYAGLGGLDGQSSGSGQVQSYASGQGQSYSGRVGMKVTW